MLNADDLAALERQLVANEGLRTYLYDDATGERITQGTTVVGHPTWGIGFNCDALGFSTDAITAEFQFRLQERINEVVAALPWSVDLPSGPLRAILDIAWNAGVEGLLEFHKMLTAAQKRDWLTAATEIINSKLAPARAQRLAALMRTV